jgi:hypothetical protein
MVISGEFEPNRNFSRLTQFARNPHKNSHLGLDRERKTVVRPDVGMSLAFLC